MLKYQQTNQKAWSVTLNGCDIDEAKILHLGGKPLNAPEGQSSFIVLCLIARKNVDLYFLFKKCRSLIKTFCF